VLAALVASLAAVSMANASVIAVLPAATSSTTCSVTPGAGAILGAGSCSQTSSFGHADLTLTQLPFAGLSAHATVTGGAIQGAGANAVLDYRFEVVGGNPGDIVPLLISTNLFSDNSGGATGSGFARILITTALAHEIGVTVCSAGYVFPCSESRFSGSFGVMATSGFLNEVYMDAYASVSSNFVSGAQATAMVDPMISIDPAFAGANGYSIVLSPGIGNATSAVPLPGSQNLLVGGLAPLVLWLRKRRLASKV
jgi:hypothetical protein